MKRTTTSILALVSAIAILPLLPSAATAQGQGQGQNNNPNTTASIIQRVLAAHGPSWITGDIKDWIAEGKLTYFNAGGPGPTFDVTYVRKGPAQAQRIVKQSGAEVRVGSNGVESWDSLNGWFVAAARGQALQLIESQTIRSVPALLDYQTRGLLVRDAGKNSNTQRIESEDREGRKTVFSIDDASSTVTKVEFVTGQTKDAFGKVISTTDAYVFSDYRQIQGLLTPFKTERYINGIRAEEIRLSSVKYNTSVQDAAFKP